VAAELRGKDLGDGLVHRVAYQVARSITWDAGTDGNGDLMGRTATSRNRTTFRKQDLFFVSLLPCFLVSLLPSLPYFSY
jgi:hypothetical protein